MNESKKLAEYDELESNPILYLKKIKRVLWNCDIILENSKFFNNDDEAHEELISTNISYMNKETEKAQNLKNAFLEGMQDICDSYKPKGKSSFKGGDIKPKKLFSEEELSQLGHS